MKVLLQAGSILAVVALLTGLTYWIKGGPNRYPTRELVETKGEDEVVPKGQIKLADVLDHLDGKVVWVDARSRSEWKFDGVKGSIFISSDPRENMDQLIEDNVDQLFAAEIGNIPIVIYCGNSGCTDSEMVKKAIEEAGFKSKVFLLYKGYESIAAWPEKLTK